MIWVVVMILESVSYLYREHSPFFVGFFSLGTFYFLANCSKSRLVTIFENIYKCQNFFFSFLLKE